MGFKYAMILYDLNVWQCVKCVGTHALSTNLVRHKGFPGYVSHFTLMGDMTNEQMSRP